MQAIENKRYTYIAFRVYSNEEWVGNVFCNFSDTEKRKADIKISYRVSKYGKDSDIIEKNFSYLFEQPVDVKEILEIVKPEITHLFLPSIKLANSTYEFNFKSNSLKVIRVMESKFYNPPFDIIDLETQKSYIGNNEEEVLQLAFDNFIIMQ